MSDPAPARPSNSAKKKVNNGDQLGWAEVGPTHSLQCSWKRVKRFFCYVGNRVVECDCTSRFRLSFVHRYSQQNGKTCQSIKRNSEQAS